MFFLIRTPDNNPNTHIFGHNKYFCGQDSYLDLPSKCVGFLCLFTQKTYQKADILHIGKIQVSLVGPHVFFFEPEIIPNTPPPLSGPVTEEVPSKAASVKAPPAFPSLEPESGKPKGFLGNP